MSHFNTNTYSAPADRPATHIRHLRGAYKAAGLEVPAALSDVVDEALRAYAGKVEAEGEALLLSAWESGDTAVAEQAAAAFAHGAAYRAGAERAANTLRVTRLHGLPDLREQAARDLEPAFKAEVETLAGLAQKFDPEATTTLDPGVLGEQRQYKALAVLDDVQRSLRTLGAFTLVPTPSDPRGRMGTTRYADALYPAQLVAGVTYGEEAGDGTPVWMRGKDRQGMSVFDNDVYLLAVAGGWLPDDATVEWRLLTG